MQIKKKDVILESLLIDVSPDFTPQEKRLLKVLNKKFGKGGMYSNFNRWDGATFLIEDFGLPYDMAHNLSLSFWWYGDKLFEEMEPLHKKERRNYVFMQVFDDIKAEYVKEKNEIAGEIDLTWEDRNHFINATGDTFTLKQEVTLWDGFRGFTLYIPFHDVNDNNDDLHMFTTNLSMLVYVKLVGDDDESNDENSNTSIKVEVSWVIKEIWDERMTLMNFDVPIPSPLNKSDVINIFNSILGDVFEKLESMVFRTE